jgi:hypothetical protein
VAISTFATRPKSETDPLPALTYEQLDVMQMALPPGWRGYGTKEHIDHPNTARRLAEIEALTQRRNGADRFALQEKLMPYEHLLPERFRGRNERVDAMMERTAPSGRCAGCITFLVASAPEVSQAEPRRRKSLC